MVIYNYKIKIKHPLSQDNSWPITTFLKWEEMEQNDEGGEKCCKNNFTYLKVFALLKVIIYYMSTYITHELEEMTVK